MFNHHAKGRLGRLVVSAPFAALAVTGLALLMQSLISGPETLAIADRATIELQILSDKADTEVDKRREQPELAQDMLTPPSAPQPRAVEADVPDVPLTGAAALPPIKDDPLGPIGIEISSVEQPLRRPTRFPEAAVRRNLSGECRVTVDVTEEGRVTNIRAQCTDPVFTNQIMRDAPNWRYRAATEGRTAVMRRDRVVIVEFEAPQ